MGVTNHIFNIINRNRGCRTSTTVLPEFFFYFHKSNVPAVYKITCVAPLYDEKHRLRYI